MIKLVNIAVALPILFSTVSTSFAIVNHSAATPSSSSAPKSHPAQRLQDLNRVIGTEFTGVAEFPYWDHVGMVGMGSGIYLGDGYVLTSAHVGCSPFRMHNGTAHEPEYKSWRVLKNADGTKSDLATFRVHIGKTSKLAGLAPLPFGTGQTRGNSPVILMGTGYLQGDKPMTLSSQGNVIGVLGYRVQPRRSAAWAINRAAHELEQPVQTLRELSTRCFATRFESTPFSGQAADGDSGGAAFSFNRESGRWELAGCIIAVSQERDSVVFGSRTFVGDVAHYVPQIPPAKGTGTAQPVATLEPAAPASNAVPIQARPAAIGKAVR